MTDGNFEIVRDIAVVKGDFVNGKVINKRTEFEVSHMSYDDAITFIKAVCDIASEKRVRGYIKSFTFDADNNTVIVKEIKSKE